ncbi:hypothetical protein [Psychrobacter proteolyticus]|nr:hypothetical protein [Psychrobacter proteolyticus]
MKKHREFLKSIAHKMQGEAKMVSSSFTSHEDNQDSEYGSLFDDDSAAQ